MCPDAVKLYRKLSDVALFASTAGAGGDVLTFPRNPNRFGIVVFFDLGTVFLQRRVAGVNLSYKAIAVNGNYSAQVTVEDVGPLIHDIWTVVIGSAGAHYEAHELIYPPDFDEGVFHGQAKGK